MHAGVGGAVKNHTKTAENLADKDLIQKAARKGGGDANTRCDEKV